MAENKYSGSIHQLEPKGLKLPDKGGKSGGMDVGERLAKLEGAVEGLRATQSIMLASIGLVLTVVLGFGFFGLNRFNTLDSQVQGLPSKISSDLRDLTGTLSQAITAAKQQPPQVILLPSPNLPIKGGDGSSDSPGNSGNLDPTTQTPQSQKR